jgi:SAM-dependent methyltransferase
MERIELLSTDLLREQKALAHTFRRLARRLGIQLGWHYLLDLVWVAGNLSDRLGGSILDAGAGLGVLQWWLAEQGASVLSVDRQDRQELPFRYRSRYDVKGLRDGDLIPASQVLRRRIHSRDMSYVHKVGALARILGGIALAPLWPKAAGSIILYQHDLSALPDVPPESIDVVVAVSSLEHNAPEALPAVIEGLMRVLKKGGLLVATLAAARDLDWYHRPSKGWCYTDASLRRLFGLKSETPSNYDQYDRLMADLRGCEELRRELAPFHFLSGENGMPWGEWDPQYQPVGIVKVKATEDA